MDRAIQELKTFGGYEVKIGIEIEFALLDAKTMQPIDHGIDCNLSLLMNLVDDFHDLYMKLKDHDINIEAIHKECGFGQYEMVMNYGDLKKTLDDYYLSREIITQHFRKKGLIASFLPKPFANSMGNGAHIHLSLWKNGKNITGDLTTEHQISKEGE